MLRVADRTARGIVKAGATTAATSSAQVASTTPAVDDGAVAPGAPPATGELAASMAQDKRTGDSKAPSTLLSHICAARAATPADGKRDVPATPLQLTAAVQSARAHLASLARNERFRADDARVIAPAAGEPLSTTEPLHVGRTRFFHVGDSSTVHQIGKFLLPKVSTYGIEDPVYRMLPSGELAGTRRTRSQFLVSLLPERVSLTRSMSTEELAVWNREDVDALGANDYTFLNRFGIDRAIFVGLDTSYIGSSAVRFDVARKELRALVDAGLLQIRPHGTVARPGEGLAGMNLELIFMAGADKRAFASLVRSRE